MMQTIPNDYQLRVRERAQAVAAIDAMIARRPLRPPPFPRTCRVRSAGAIELALEIARGAYVP